METGNMMSLIKRFIRRLGFPSTATSVPMPSGADDPTFEARKQAKLARIRPLLVDGPAHESGPLFYDFLTDELRQQFHITDTDNVSAHDYDWTANEIIRQFSNGLILDCGAGLRKTYYDNVVNFEICPYSTTDVRGVGEKLPFRSGVFDAVFSFNVLEHVRDPFAAARELSRVLKPGGRLYAVVPFLQPFHAFPHHYYNMSAQGLANLFEDTLVVEKQEVNMGGMPIFMLTWVLRRWAEELPSAVREQFLNRKVSDLIGDPLDYTDQPFVTALPKAAQFELAATTSLFARKPINCSPSAEHGTESDRAAGS